MAVLDNQSLTVPQIDGSYDGGMVVRQYKTLTINNTVTTNHHGRGMTIYVQGNCVINGSLSVRPSNSVSGSIVGEVDSGGVNYPIITSTGGGTLNAVNVEGCGDEATVLYNQDMNLSGKTGYNFHLDKYGADDQVDEGGDGGDNNECCWGQGAGHGGGALAFGAGGGSGGGPGCHGGAQHMRSRSSTTSGGEGADWGCHGGGGGGGGAGLPYGTPGGGTGAANGSTSTKNGTLFLIVGGNLSGTGNIDLRGSTGGRGGDGQWSGTGGAGSGGGVCFIAVKGTNSFCSFTTGTSTGTHSGGSGSILLSGGSGGAGGTYTASGGCVGQSGKNGFCKVIAMA
jgi:hypothetical protein